MHKLEVVMELMHILSYHGETSPAREYTNVFLSEELFCSHTLAL